MSVLFILVSINAFADGVPRCWAADQPGVNLQDGVFRVMVPTDDTVSSHDVALIMLMLSQSLANQLAAGAPSDLRHIEIDMYGELKYWQPSAAFPTLESFKTAVLNSMAPVLNMHATIECAYNVPHTH